MRDSTLYIGALASNNVNNIVNDAGKYDEYKEKVKDLTKEIQTRKDTFEKMAEPLVYVCDCYQKFNVVTGMPKSTFGDSFGYDMQKDISSHMTDFYAGKVMQFEKQSPADVKKNLGLPSFAADRTVRQASAYTGRQARAAMEACLRAEYQVKSGAWNQEGALEACILEIFQIRKK